MKTNNATLETQLEARCSTSQPRIWYSMANANEIPSASSYIFADVSAWEAGTTTVSVARNGSYTKYGDKVTSVRGCMNVMFPASDTAVFYSEPDFAVFEADTMTFSIRLLGESATTMQISIDDGASSTDSVAAALSASAWRVHHVTHIMDASGPAQLRCTLKSLHGDSCTVYADGAKLEHASSVSNWSARFFDVDDIKSDGVTINAIEFSSLLCGQIEWGQRPDESAPAPLMSFTSSLRFEFVDDGSTLSNWTRQQTGIHLRIGANTSSEYQDCTPTFHGIIWDWELVDGTENHYRVECCGLEKLWQEQTIGADAVDGPRRFGIERDTITSISDKYAYKTPSGAGHHLYKATYDNHEVNRQNAVVCKWNYQTTTDATHMVHFMFPVTGGKEIIADYFEQKSYSDLIEYFESATGMTNNMPESRLGHTGDTLTATLGPWAHLESGVSAWRSLADAAGRKYYGYRYDENGQIALKSLAGTRSAEAVARTSATPGNVRKVQRLDDTYRVNDACVEFTKYGIDSATGSSIPVQTTTNAFTSTFVMVSGEQHALVTTNSGAAPVCPRWNAGDVLLDDFADTVSVPGFAVIDVALDIQAFEANSGVVTIAGDGVCEIDCPAVADAAVVESINALTSPYAFFMKVEPNVTNKLLFIYISLSGGTYTVATDPDRKVAIVFNTDGYVDLRYFDAGGTLYYWTGLSGSDVVWAASRTQRMAYSANTAYWVSIINDGTDFHLAICDSEGCPIGGYAQVTVAVADCMAGAEQIQVGLPWIDTYTCDSTIHEIRKCRPAAGYAWRITTGIADL